MTLRQSLLSLIHILESQISVNCDVLFDVEKFPIKKWAVSGLFGTKWQSHNTARPIVALDLDQT